MTEPKYMVTKSTGHLKWEVRDMDGVCMDRFATRKHAQALVDAAHGDRDAVRLLYRLDLRYAERRMTHADALRYAMLCAQERGCSPGQVGADPKTGEPLEDSEKLRTEGGYKPRCD